MLPITSRTLFVLNLLPALQRATSLRRVVSVAAAGFEGYFDDSDWVGFGTKNFLKARGHFASMATMAHNALARRAPGVSFVHNFPGAVKTEFGKDVTGWMGVVRKVLKVVGSIAPLRWLPNEECGARQLYNATSARFPPAAGDDAAGVPRPDHVPLARGADGTPGSGSYSIGVDCESSSPEVEQHLAKARADGAEEKLWAHLLGEIEQITGKAR